LAGRVKFGAVDATVETGLAQKFEIKGFPTIKYFVGSGKAFYATLFLYFTEYI
jgi:protein disulfide-isomerase A6